MSQLRIGLIGAGGRGTSLAYQVKVSNLGAVVGAYDADPEFARQFQEPFADFSIPFVSRAELLSDSSLDGIIIASPDHCHLQDACDALKSGKPVLCEKPMAIKLADCDAMLQAQRDTGQSLQIGFNLRFHPLYQKMHEIAASGKLGKITTVWIRHFVGMGGNFYFQDWHSLRNRSESLLLQKATHDFDVLHYVAGSYTKRLSAIGNRAYYGGDRENSLCCPQCTDKGDCPEANLGTKNPRNQCAFRKEIDVEDNEIVMLELESGVLATYSQCHFTPDYHRNYVFIGTKGRMESFETQHRVQGWQTDDRIEVLYRDGGQRETVRFDLEQGNHGGADIRMIKSWLNCVLNKSFDSDNPIGGRQSVAAGCLAAESLRTGNVWRDIPRICLNSSTEVSE